MSVYRVVENQKPSLPVDEWTLCHRIREGRVQPQTIIHCDGQAMPAGQIPALAPMFNQTVRPLAPYLQPSQAGFIPCDVSAHSARFTGTQVIGILIALGCLVLLLLSLSRPGATSALPGQWQKVATAEGPAAIRGEVVPSR